MSLWEHGDLAREATIEAVGQPRCIFCKGKLLTLHTDESTHQSPSVGISQGPTFTLAKVSVERCSRCGWWKVKKTEDASWTDHEGMAYDNRVLGAAGCLKRLDLTDLSVPTQEIRDYLVGRYDERAYVHPKKFEDVVASVFRNQGYEAVVTNYSGDDGIDVILRSTTDTIGVQVKRYKGAIEVDQIRELAGSLLLGNLSRGMFVTTSRFTSGAISTSERFAMKGHPIELVDSDRFYAELEIAQVQHHREYDEEIVRNYLSRITLLEHEGYTTRGQGF